jgi:hypothetical protein
VTGRSLTTLRCEYQIRIDGCHSANKGARNAPIRSSHAHE